MKVIKLIPVALLLTATTAQAAQGLKSGEQVYKEACFACHATGVDKAPQFGERTAWAPLIKEGQHVLTAHAWVGVRGMPPKGGRPDLSLEEFARAVAYMARAAGGDWKDPDAAMLARIRAEEKKRIEQLKHKK
jgi:cytochrome c5